MYKSKYISNNLTEEEAPIVSCYFFFPFLLKKIFPYLNYAWRQNTKNITFNLKCLNEK
jgi:hypothetical protein